MISIILGAVYLVVGLLIVAHGIHGGYLALQSSAWPSTSGRVVVSEVEAGLSSQYGGRFYQPRVEYRYEVRGNEFVGDCLFFGDWIAWPMASIARRYTDRYRLASEVTVFYDPVDPETAVLEPGFHVVILYGCAGALLFAAMGFLMLYQEM